MAGKVALSRATILALAVFLAFVLVVVMIIFQLNNNRELTAGIAEEEAALDRARADLSRLVKLRDNEPEYRDRLSLLERLVPAEPGEEELLHHIHNLAEENKLRVVEVRFAGRSEDGGAYTGMPLQITLEGPYRGVLEMLGGIRGGHRALRVDQVSIGGVSPEIRVDLAAQAFFKTAETSDEP